MVDFTLLHLFDKSKQKQAYNPPLPRSSVAAGRSPPPLHVHLNWTYKRLDRMNWQAVMTHDTIWHRLWSSLQLRLLLRLPKDIYIISRAINEKLSREKLVRSHVIGCHVRCFRGRDNNAMAVSSSSSIPFKISLMSLWSFLLRWPWRLSTRLSWRKLISMPLKHIRKAKICE